MSIHVRQSIQKLELVVKQQKMKNLTEKIYKELLSRNNVLLVGLADSGKTYYVTNELIPFLKNKGFNVAYFTDCDHLSNIPNKTNIVIIDEVETLIDKSFLEQRYPKDKPYYSPGYLKKVEIWHNKLKLIKIPSVFILTRTKKEETEYLLDSAEKMDWGGTC